MPEHRVLGFVGARTGSKGLPGKNIKNFHGKPLIQWTLECLQGSELLTDVVVSTDGEDIAKVCREAGAWVPFLRPPELATDEANICDVILYTLDRLRKEEGRNYTHVMLAHPTVPLRQSWHIDEAVSKYFKDMNSPTETLVSGKPIPSKYGWMMHRTEEGYMDFSLGDIETMPLQRQAFIDRFLPNGALWIFPVKDFKGDLYRTNTQLYIMDDIYSVDIDTMEDFNLAWKNFEELTALKTPPRSQKDL